MNSRGQEALEYLLLIGGAILIAVIVGAMLTPTSSSSSAVLELGADNFCEAWVEENNVILLDADFYYKLGNMTDRFIECSYSSDSEVFDGGVSPGTTKKIEFTISEPDLLKWSKIKPEPCCQECC